MQNFGAYMGSETIRLGYFPFEEMVVFNGKEYQLNSEFIEKLPMIMIFNVVNKDRTIDNKDGEWITDLIVTHTGFIVKGSNGQIFVYHSTSKTDTALSIMAQEDLLSFLEKRYLHDYDGTSVGLHLSEPPTRITATSAIKEML